ncbi:hypothetical protein AAHE18_14G058100 [Arachis hypogaea]
MQDGGGAGVERTQRSSNVGEERGGTARCGDDAVSGTAETDSGEAAREVFGGGWLGAKRRRERKRGGGVVSRLREEGEGDWVAGRFSNFRYIYIYIYMEDEMTKNLE